MDCHVAAAVFDLLHAHRVSLFAHSCIPLNLFAIRTRFAPSVRKSAPRNDMSVILSDSEGSQTPHPVFRFSAKAQNRKQISPSKGEVKKVAFTLAEVLITLGIIGVVAAMTLPTVIQNHKKQVVEAQLKKAYNTMSNAFRLSEVDNGPMADWPQAEQLNINEFWKIYLNPYFSGARVCESMPACGYKNLDPSKWAFASWGLFTGDSRILFQLSDGTVIFLPRNTSVVNEDGETVPAYVDFLLIDVNGTKLPNELGRDVFYFRRDYQNGRLYAPKGNCANDARLCTNLIMSNSWKIPDDYPRKL